MNPKEFTDYVVPKLRAALPKSRLYQVENHADAAYLEIPSRRGKLHLLDRKGVICSSVLGPFPGDQEDLERVAKYRQETETIELKYWSSF